MNHSFKIGDTVKCIDNNDAAKNYLILNKIYTIKDIHLDGFIQLIGIKDIGNGDIGWNPNRFKLIKNINNEVISVKKVTGSIWGFND